MCLCLLFIKINSANTRTFLFYTFYMFYFMALPNCLLNRTLLYVRAELVYLLLTVTYLQKFGKTPQALELSMQFFSWKCVNMFTTVIIILIVK